MARARLYFHSCANSEAHAAGGLVSQCLVLLDLAAALRLEVVEVYEDWGGGPLLERPDLSRLLGHLQQGEAVLVTGVSRLSRDPRALRELLEIVGRTGASVATPAGPLGQDAQGRAEPRYPPRPWTPRRN